MTSNQRDSQLRQDILDFFANPPMLWPLVGPILFYSIAFSMTEQMLKTLDVPTFCPPRK